MSVPENPKQTKNPITLKIKFKSSSLEQFIERYSVDVSKSGIFIRTKEPLAVGTQLRFEFQLQDGNALLSGEGTVVWNRAADPSRSSVAPGMGVRFDKLSADSQKVLERILSEKARRPDSNLESRFDAGFRAAAAEASVPIQSQQTPKGDNGSFGDEPTRAMPADQVTKLAAAAMQEEEMPTKHSPPDLTDEVRRAVGAAAESVKQMAPMTPMTAQTAPAGPAAGLSRTLLGQGFMNPRPTPGGSKDAPSVPGGSSRDAPSIEVVRKEASQPLNVPSRNDGGQADSAKTPTASADEQRARIADSNRTPTGPSKSGGDAPSIPPTASPPGSKTPEPMGKPPESLTRTPVPVSKPPESLTRTPAPVSKPPEPAAFPTPPEAAPAAFSMPMSSSGGTQSMAKASGSSTGLIIGVVVLVAILGALGYVFVFNKDRGVKPTTTSGSVDPTSGGAGTTPAADTAGNPGAKPGTTEPAKPPEPLNVPIKPAESADGIEVTTEPPGARIDFGGKQYPPTPTRVPGLTVGSQIKLSLRGYQEALIRLHNQPEEGKPLFFKLTAIDRVVEINSTPKGADVLLDGKKVGKTPFVLKKLDTAKVHQIELRRAGFAPWTHNVSDTESFVVKNRKEVLTLNATLTTTEEANKKGAHGPKHEGAAGPAAPAAPPGAPAEAPKTPEAAPPAAAPAPAPAPEPAKEPAKEPAAQ